MDIIEIALEALSVYIERHLKQFKTYVTSALVFTNLMKGKIISHIIEVISKTPRMQTMLNQPCMTKKTSAKNFFILS